VRFYSVGTNHYQGRRLNAPGMTFLSYAVKLFAHLECVRRQYYRCLMWPTLFLPASGAYTPRYAVFGGNRQSGKPQCNQGPEARYER